MISGAGRRASRPDERSGGEETDRRRQPGDCNRIRKTRPAERTAFGDAAEQRRPGPASTTAGPGIARRRRQWAGAAARRTPTEELEIDLAAPGIDCNRDVAAGRIVTDAGGNGLERRDAQRRPAGGERQAAHEGEADPDAGECPGAAGGGKAIEIPDGNRCHGEEIPHHHRQAFGLAGLHRLEGAPQHPVLGAVEESGGTRLQRRVEAEDQHFVRRGAPVTRDEVAEQIRCRASAWRSTTAA